MRNIKLTLEYDGSTFYGFQKQPKKPTVQDSLEKAFFKLFKKKIKISAASGRTDAGVHAKAHIVNFLAPSDLELYKIQKGLNYYLPNSIAVIQIEEVEKEFHARFDAKSKVYEYSVWNASERSPLLIDKTYHFPHKLNISSMKRAAKFFIGKHNFKSFTSEKARAKSGVDPSKLSYTRTIKKLNIRKKDSLITFELEADGFLFHMVRNITGTLLEVGAGRIDEKDIPRIIRSKNRISSGPTLPAQGLLLSRVYY